MRPAVFLSDTFSILANLKPFAQRDDGGFGIASVWNSLPSFCAPGEVQFCPFASFSPSGPNCTSGFVSPEALYLGRPTGPTKLSPFLRPPYTSSGSPYSESDNRGIQDGSSSVTSPSFSLPFFFTGIAQWRQIISSDLDELIQ